ncbi:hypothetical protein E8E15_010954 [Penicillium rubens]|nr:hypothetical protein E8E15_010954 [Penicillium rubens]
MSLATFRARDDTVVTVPQMFILLAPLWVNAFDYMVPARMVHFFVPGRRIGMFKPPVLAKVFALLDIGSFVVQMIGGFMANGTDEQQMHGIHVYMGGIGIQEFFIVCFLVLAVQFHRAMLQLERAGRLPIDRQRWRPLLYALYGSLIAITWRIIYRLIEFSSGYGESNRILYHEWVPMQKCLPVASAGGSAVTAVPVAVEAAGRAAREIIRSDYLIATYMAMVCHSTTDSHPLPRFTIH